MILLRFSLFLEEISALINILLLLAIAIKNLIIYLKELLAYISFTIARNLSLI